MGGPSYDGSESSIISVVLGCIDQDQHALVDSPNIE